MSILDETEGYRRSRSISPVPYRESASVSMRETRGREDSSASNSGTTLFVTALSKEVEERELQQVFSPFGMIERCQIMRDPHSRESRGFGFVAFSTPEEADAALSIDGTELGGRNVIVQKSKRARARTPTPGQYFGPMKERDGRDSRDRRRSRENSNSRENSRERYPYYEDRRRYDDYPPARYSDYDRYGPPPARYYQPHPDDRRQPMHQMDRYPQERIPMDRYPGPSPGPSDRYSGPADRYSGPGPADRFRDERRY